MKAKKRILLLALLVFLVCPDFPLAQEQAGKLFEKALFLEESEGNLLKAITLYEKIVKDYSKELDIAAKAQLHIGFCYEKLGKTEAIKAYELVVENYSSQKEQVAAALARLDELKQKIAEGLSIVKLGGWDKPGIFIQPFEITFDNKMMVGVEFIKGQNIIVYDLETKELKNITNHLWSAEGYCWTYNPVLSPDGKEIAYYSSSTGSAEPAGNNLIISTLDGQFRIIDTADEEGGFIPSAWLPDGSAVLTIKVNNGEVPQLGLIPWEGGEFRNLVPLQNKNVGVGRNYAMASVSPDGKHILFTDAVPDEKSDIYIMGSDGGNPKPLFKHPAAEKYPRWSPDGKSIAFLSMRHGSWALWGLAVKNGEAVGEPFLIQDGMQDSYLLNWTDNALASWLALDINDIYLVDVNQETGEPVGIPNQFQYSPTGENVLPVWSPDKKSFAFLKGNFRSFDGSRSIIIADGSNIKEFHIPAGYGAGAPKWTADGSKIGMMVAGKEKKWLLLYLIVESGEWETTPISDVEGVPHFDWSSSDKTIFLTRSGKGVVELDLETGKEKYLYQDSSATIFRWLDCSWDKKRLAFLVLNKELLLDIMVINLETRDIHKVGTELGYFSWSGDGLKIVSNKAFNTKANKQALFIAPESGGPAVEFDLSQYLPSRSEIQFPDWSLDGKKIIFNLKSTQSEVSLFRNIIPSEK